MIIGGVEKLTLLDYPDHLAAIIFTQGCNFRCHFCYNPMLVWPVGETENIKQKDHLISEQDLFAFLRKRQGKLEAVVISGGEPTMHKDLPEFMQQIKDLGYKIKLDTNGTNPEMLENLIKQKLIDYIAMDLKAPWNKYGKVAGVKPDSSKLKKSVNIILESTVPYEFRTTLVPGLHSGDDVLEMAGQIKGARAWYLQKFQSDKDLVDNDWQNRKTFSDKDLRQIAKKARTIAGHCQYREY